VCTVSRRIECKAPKPAKRCWQDSTVLSLKEGWREFAAIYRPLVYRVARAKGLQHADAEDLTQDVLAVVERSLDQFDPTIGGFRSWLYQITRNLVVKHAKMLNSERNA